MRDKPLLDDILFYGDPHGNFQPLFNAIKKRTPSAVILLGDLCLTAPLEQVLAPVLKVTDNVYWIAGNHDNDSEESLDFLFNSALADRNLHARVIEIDGLKIAGLGGIFKGKIWFPKNKWETPSFKSRNDLLASGSMEPKLKVVPLKYATTIFPEDVSKMIGEKCDILVSHESGCSSSLGFFMIDEVAQRMNAKIAIHGHLHKSYVKLLNNGVWCVGCDQAQPRWGNQIKSSISLALSKSELCKT